MAVLVDQKTRLHAAIQELLGKDTSSRFKFIMEKTDQAIAEDLDV